MTSDVDNPPADFRGKPVLRGVGVVRHWVAGTRTAQLSIETTAPTPELLKRLGMLLPMAPARSGLHWRSRRVRRGNYRAHLTSRRL
ncbi:hypothetical protein ACIRSS_37340 [Amycolatopsis sp. NPDC101161]|uniref:hypothetical protein n=1 Tax=Amycolatopsis sp. NPDC101161 TaxID=3363940 RepID=UPI00380A41BC